MLVSPENRHCLFTWVWCVNAAGVLKAVLDPWQLSRWTLTERTRLWQQTLIHGSAEVCLWACGRVWRCHQEQISLGWEIFFFFFNVPWDQKTHAGFKKRGKWTLRGTVHTLTHTAETLTICSHVHWVMKRQDIPIIPKQAGTRIYVLHEQCVERTPMWIQLINITQCCLGCGWGCFQPVYHLYLPHSPESTCIITGVEATIMVLYIVGYNSVRSW